MVHLSEISHDESFYVHDVFLSFRGADTRNSFTDHLHKALLDANIDTFLDDAEMKTGQELKTELVSAIKTSKASIIVLSKNYASSTWCLDELALIMEQHRTTKHVVFPIFYHVEPIDKCFLEDIERRCREPDGLLDLQKKLLKDIQDGSWMDISNTDVGTFKTEKSLLRKKTLLVLDSVDNLEQLDVLIGAKGLHPGSKIIITSKNGSLTEKCRLFQTQVPPTHSKYFLKGLNEKESLQLLSWLAFGCNEPKEDEKKGSMKVVKYCCGHPLAIKVLGSSVRNEDATMEDILESLGKEINPDIKKVLRISFDSLPYEKDKELFKHIACFFVGEDKKLTEEILRACGICKSSGIMILINRGLLTLVSNKLVMHQLLQDMGRDLVLQESPKKPWKRSLLWNHECLDMLQNSKGTTRIKGLYYLVLGISSQFRNKKCGFETLAIREMPNRRLLQLNYVELNGSYNFFPEGLRWLCMHGFPLSYIPSDLPMENMVALDMSNSKLQQLWKEPKLLRSLKFLNLKSCFELVSVGPFSGLPALENLILERCTSLVEVNKLYPASSSAIVKAIPRTLETFQIFLPHSLVSLSLRNNNLYGESFPNDFSSLAMLKYLHLDDNPIESLPDYVRSLSRMEDISFARCRRLKTVLGAPSKIKYLLITDCFSLEKVTFHQEMSALPCITYFRGECLTEIEGKFKLEDINEEILCSLGWMNIEYLRYYNVSMANSDSNYRFLGKIIPKQVGGCWFMDNKLIVVC
nr:putative Toll/interleukin-1 receptor (TIR) domain-containing protein [Tanacetum cinerariifolium]